MSNHTPGPWGVMKMVDGFIDVAQLDAINNKKVPVLAIASVYFRDQEANASLIAAAPDQNAALLEVEKWWRLPNAQRTIENIEPAMRLVFAAIAKAEGINHD